MSHTMLSIAPDPIHIGSTAVVDSLVLLGKVDAFPALGIIHLNCLTKNRPVLVMNDRIDPPTMTPSL